MTRVKGSSASVKEPFSREHAVLLEQFNVLARVCDGCSVLINVGEFAQIDEQFGCGAGHVRELLAEDEFETLDSCSGELFANVATRVARWRRVRASFERIVNHAQQLFVHGAG